MLQDTKIAVLKSVLVSVQKQAKDIYFPNLDLEKYLVDINEILQSKVEEKAIILRWENSSKKREFAEGGLKIHQKGDICAFCGKRIDDETFAELESYFSADEVKALRARISKAKDKVEQEIADLEIFKIVENDFYPEFLEAAKTLNSQIQSLKNQYIELLSGLNEALQKKASDIFDVTDELSLEIPDNFDIIKAEYESLVTSNNQNDLPKKQQEAKDELRFHEIKILLNKFNYDVEQVELGSLETIKKKEKDALDGEKKKIIGSEGLKKQILTLEKEIRELEAQTKDEKRLAENTNKKLKYSVSFELEHCEDEAEKGFYQVKCLRTGITRDTTQLSTGEKNIIAFLYFIEKLEEVVDNSQGRQNQVIVFDDPMTSNDDTMQYLMIDELQKLMKNVKNPNKLILLTHNNHFYLNVKYGRKYKEDRFIRFLSNGNKTKFLLLTKEQEDFKTNYEALWKDLKFLVGSEDASSSMVLNPIRRIIETYTKFNEISIKSFYENQNGARKLFDVNSHAIDDLEADLTGKTKEEIIVIMKKCFEDNKAIDHYNKHWNE